MNNLKFRVWDTKYKKWAKPPIEFIPYQMSWNKDMYLEVKDEGYNDTLIFLQYIKLKDMNGKEIYEGDIVRFYNESRPRGYVDLVVDDPILGEFVYLNYKEMGSSYIEEESEVIGNIYENPELLKGGE